jgi:hypothetical protein
VKETAKTVASTVKDTARTVHEHAPSKERVKETAKTVASTVKDTAYEYAPSKETVREIAKTVASTVKDTARTGYEHAPSKERVQETATTAARTVYEHAPRKETVKETAKTVASTVKDTASTAYEHAPSKERVKEVATTAASTVKNAAKTGYEHAPSKESVQETATSVASTVKETATTVTEYVPISVTVRESATTEEEHADSEEEQTNNALNEEQSIGSVNVSVRNEQRRQTHTGPPYSESLVENDHVSATEDGGMQLMAVTREQQARRESHRLQRPDVQHTRAPFEMSQEGEDSREVTDRRPTSSHVDKESKQQTSSTLNRALSKKSQQTSSTLYRALSESPQQTSSTLYNLSESPDFVSASSTRQAWTGSPDISFPKHAVWGHNRPREKPALSFKADGSELPRSAAHTKSYGGGRRKKDFREVCEVPSFEEHGNRDTSTQKRKDEGFNQMSEISNIEQRGNTDQQKRKAEAFDHISVSSIEQHENTDQQRREAEANKTNILCMSVVTLVFVSCYLCCLLATLVEHSDSSFQEAKHLAWVELFKCLLYVSNVVKPFVYVIFDPQFRDNLKAQMERFRKKA